MTPFFELIHEDKRTGVRAGVLHTAHGDVPTPCFMPVGTQASVKALDARDMEDLDAPIILTNTYHLHLRPGEDTIARLGGLHKFMNWNRPVLTDSGGFQIFSLGKAEDAHGKLCNVDDAGVTFRSHIDGSEHRFTPEIAVDIQHKLGADIIMAFDECTPDNAPHEYAKRAMERTHQWAEQSLRAHEKNKNYHGYPQHLFGIIQGSNFDDLRKTSAQFITSLPFDGIAIGGESIGYNMEATRAILKLLAPHLPAHKPRYTMGVGYQPQDFYDVVAGGADMFDCVSPTRMARNGTVFLPNGPVHITNAEYAEDARPIDSTCACHTCTRYSRAYLHHLFKAGELSAYRLATLHNLHHFLQYMRDMRTAILEDKFSEYALLRQTS